uniref:peptidylprolyl isomerase n=1 Tax=Plectus sambesii TaxID=2011161 RepID=A0A914VGJ0_9BILA
MTALEEHETKSSETIKKDWRDYTATDLCASQNDLERILRWNPPKSVKTLRPLPKLEGPGETLEHGIKKWLRKPGSGKTHPQYGNYCYMRYTAWFADSGVEFDSTTIRGNKPWMFPLGKGLGLVPGWDTAVVSMKQGETAVFSLPAAMGWPPKVPGNKALIYEVDLIKFEEEDCSKERNRSITRTYLRKPDSSLQENEWDTPNDGAIVTAAVKVTANKKIIMETDCLELKCSEGYMKGLPAGADTALKRMKKGERSLLHFKAEHGYSEEDRAALGIVSTELIEMEIDLKDYTNAAATWALSDDDYLANCETLIDDGDKLIRASQYAPAYLKLRRAEGLLRWRKCGCIRDDPPYAVAERRRIRRNQLYLMACLHLSLACYELEKLDETVEFSGRALAEEPGNPTALGRRAKARKLLGDYEAAAADLESIVKSAPADKDAQQELIAIRKVSKSAGKKVSFTTPTTS